MHCLRISFVDRDKSDDLQSYCGATINLCYSAKYKYKKKLTRFSIFWHRLIILKEKNYLRSRISPDYRKHLR